MSPARKLVLIVIDGLTPAVFEHAVEGDGFAALRFLAEHGSYRRAVSTFPSLTPVCLSSIATGAGPDVHEIPHLVWYHRGDRRVVEYGSSFGAVRRAGTLRSLRDTVYAMNERHLGSRAVTLYEAVEDAGLTAAAINITCYRGRTPHRPTVPGLTRQAFGPKRFFYYNLFESDRTGARLGVLDRAAGSLDAYAAEVGRWLVTRDGFDLLVLYLPDFDFASHFHGPEGAHEALGRSDRAVGALLEAAGGPDEFLERYAVILCSDHGQTAVREAASLEARFGDLPLLDEGVPRRAEVVVTASNRAGMVYRLDGCREDVRALAERLDGEPAAEVVLFREEGQAIARREGAELRFAPGEDGWSTGGDVRVLDHLDGLERAWAALANPNAGDVIVSAAAGYEFSDSAGGHHVGGGSHGSLVSGDSEVPMLTVGLAHQPASITAVAPAALAHFGLEPPPYSRALARVA
ncbi:MAG: alkaline phosphatase family protein [Actinobacteria bacterium]|nr:alkaline phosphatase family protein [Actinomycetota bacterium]